MTTTPDIFTNVHKGIRRALFTACVAVGAASGDEAREAAARATLRSALGFVAQHGDNEDVLLVPRLRDAAPEVAKRMDEAHRVITPALEALTARAPHADAMSLYHETCAFIALYLAHMGEEEIELAPLIRSAIPADALVAFARESVARTAPEDARAMLGFMIPAMTKADADAMLDRLPPNVAAAFR